MGIADGTVMITGPSNSATVTATNIAACNSLVHLIDTVLLPAQSTVRPILARCHYDAAGLVLCTPSTAICQMRFCAAVRAGATSVAE